MRKKPVLEACGGEGTTWLLAKPSIGSRDLLSWAKLTFRKLPGPCTNSCSELGSLKFPLAAAAGSCSHPSSAVCCLVPECTFHRQFPLVAKLGNAYGYDDLLSKSTVLGTKCLRLLYPLAAQSKKGTKKKKFFLIQLESFFSLKGFCMDAHGLLWLFSEQGKARPSA